MLDTAPRPRVSPTSGTTPRPPAMSEPELLLYRSNLLGADKRITNYGGGNTSAKVMEKDPLTGETVEVLWVKGSGGDLGTIKLDGFATLYMDKLERAEGALPRRRARGRDGGLPAPLHLQPQPARRLDRHAAARLSCRARMSTTCIPTRSSPSPPRRTRKELTAGDLRRRDRLAAVEAAGLRARPLAARSSRGRTRRPRASCSRATACSPGATTPKACYETTLAHHQPAPSTGSTSKTAGKPAFGGAVPPAAAARTSGAQVAARADAGDPRHDLDRTSARSAISTIRPAVLEFVDAQGPAAARGARHHLPRPFPAHQDPPAGGRLRPGEARRRRGRSPASPAALEAYRADYAAYYERCKQPDSPPMRDPEPGGLPGARRRHDHLRQGQGDGAHRRRVLRQRHQRDARRRGGVELSRPAGAGGLRHRILAARGSQAAAHAEAEEPGRPRRACHRRRRRHRRGDGRAAAARRRLRGAGRHRRERARRGRRPSSPSGIRRRRGAHASRSNVTERGRRSPRPSPRRRVEFGGVDILVSNAGIASSAPIEETDARAVEPQHGHPGDRLFPGRARGVPAVEARRASAAAIVFIGSKNGLAASPDAAAYCTAKAAEIHLARCLALEGAPHGIRVNVVNPDAVLRGSKIWTGRVARAARRRLQDWRRRARGACTASARCSSAASFPEDIAEAVYFLASDVSAKSTGNIVNVDAGNAQCVHALSAAREDAMSEQPIRATRARRAGQRSRAQRRSSATTTALGEQLDRRGIDIDAITRARSRPSASPSPPGASAPAAPASPASPAPASRATSSTSSRTAPSSTS